MGYFLLRESMLDSVLVARDKFLKPGGAMYPSHANMYLVPIQTHMAQQRLSEFHVRAWAGVEPKGQGFRLNPGWRGHLAVCWWGKVDVHAQPMLIMAAVPVEGRCHWFCAWSLCWLMCGCCLCCAGLYGGLG